MKLFDHCYIVFPHAKTLFEITTDCNELYDKLQIYYGEIFYKKITNRLNCAVKTINYFNGELSTPTTIVSKVLNNTDLALSEILRYIRNNLCLEKAFNSYHASCVKIEDKTVMLVGGTSSGKTTLTAFLSYCPNATIISEDITIVNYNDCSVSLLHRPLFLRINSYKLLSDDYNIDFKIPRFVTYSGSERVVVKDVERCLLEEAKLTAILFLKLDKDLQQTKEINGFESLLENSYSNFDFHKNVCSALSLTRRVPSFNFNYYNLEDAYEVIKEI